MNTSQYITRPPNVPIFLYKHKSQCIKNLILWANREHRDRLRYCAKRGYVREWTRLNNEYSPYRVLAEIADLRTICANITPEVWRELSNREKEFVIRSYEMYELLRRR